MSDTATTSVGYRAQFGAGNGALQRKSRQQYISGKWTDGESGELISVINPSTEQVVGQVPLGTAAEVDRAARAARAAFKTWSQSSREERLGFLKAILAELEVRSEEIANAVSLEMGAPAQVSRDVQFTTKLTRAAAIT